MLQEDRAGGPYRVPTVLMELLQGIQGGYKASSSQFAPPPSSPGFQGSFCTQFTQAGSSQLNQKQLKIHFCSLSGKIAFKEGPGPVPREVNFN